MSYASVTASNVSSDTPQPRPDPALLNTSPPRASGIADDTAKVNVVAETFKENPRTLTSEANKLPSETGKKPHTPTREANGLSSDSNETTHNLASKANKFSGQGGENARTFTLETNNFSDDGEKKSFSSGSHRKNRRLREAKAEGAYLWEVMTRSLLHPQTMGGCVGLVNLGLLAGLGRTLYVKPNLRRDTAFILQTAAAAAGLLFVEGYAAEMYHQTPRGSEEDRRAKEEGAMIYQKMREVVLRPGVLGGVVGLFNTGILGTLGYLAYANWDRPHWNRNFVSSITVGLIALVSGEGWLAEQYRK